MSIGAHIVNKYDLYFDQGDLSNASLYLGSLAGTHDTAIYAAISRLHKENLWSGQPAKKVADAQRSVYAEQMRFIACVELQTKEGVLVLARYTHPKFPSDDFRWNKWLECLSVKSGALL